ncbi:TetR/AcrR family transcriptional regulator [Rhizobium sp. XQZ8]|uniref:TetR/AcrR family transcriptional regulator n=1 Tax=Rhizobium populisoli TaxID=2859785 RepID=UPI001C683D39|nr:TetR/AcrR family transcriptional regulator [Rhizobium populisoli]MBW6420428.1 TetR/AcrR family transcriptional regulator [Rhizobium populisoli]
MNDTKKIGGRGRPRTFDRDEALAKAQALFHLKGYDALSVADLTAAIGINPPSFYAAFGNKVALYAEALRLYEHEAGLDVESALAEGVPLEEGIASILQQAADAYASGDAKGCMVIEGARSTVDPEAGAEVRSRLEASRRFIRDRIAARGSLQAELLADYLMMAMSGLSGSARNGLPLDRLRVLAEMAADGAIQHIERK